MEANSPRSDLVGLAESVFVSSGQERTMKAFV